MTFSEQVSKYRRATKMTQEELAEKCDVTRQAVAKWESGESIPDVYKISQIAEIFNISLEKLVWGEDKDDSAKTIAKDIYLQFVDCLEDLKSTVLSCSFSSNRNAAIKLRATIKKARIVYPKRIVDELYVLTEGMGEYYEDVLQKEQYKPYFASETEPHSSKRKIYAEKIIPILYEKVENLLNGYLDLPQ